MKIRELELENKSLRDELESLKQQFEQNNRLQGGLQALQLAELIISNSTAILFRRLAADDPKKRKMVYVSPNISRFGYQAEDFLDGRIMFRDIVYSRDSARTLHEISGFVEQGIDTYTQFYRIVTRQGEVRWVEDRTSIHEDPATGLRYHQGIVIDIHEQKTAEENLRKSEEKHRRIVETAGEGFILMDQSFKTIDINGAFARLVNRARSELIGNQVFNLDSDQYSHYWPSEDETVESPQYREFESLLSTSDGTAVPILVHANTLHSDTGGVIGHMAFVTDMTAQKKALQLAAEVQKGLLPEQAPAIPGLDIAGKSLACDEVGGDYFDYLQRPGQETGDISLVIGDISGHGVDSALLMSSARSCLRIRALQPGSAEDIIGTLNENMTQDVGDSGRFMTLFFLHIEREKKRIEWVRAGHDPALLYDPVDDCFDELVGPGLALGIDTEFSYTAQTRELLEPGQIITLMTDGIWEGCNKSGEMFGKERVKKIIRSNNTETSESILEEILAEYEGFTRGAVREDDLTLVVIKIL
ncbi:MAG: SpoIIE family protein phosphatase [Desulforhopalus sp.]